MSIDDDKVSVTKHGLFDVKISNTNIKFGSIQNNNIVPLYLIMKSVKEKKKIKNAIQVGTYELNELRNSIDHKSIILVDEDKLKRNLPVILEKARNTILYTFMIIRSCSLTNMINENKTAICTNYLNSIIELSVTNNNDNS